MVRPRIALLAAAAAALALSGCMTVPVSLAPSTTPLKQGQYTVVREGVDGSAWGVNLFGYPFSETWQAGKARDRALDSAGADALVNVSADVTMFTLGFVQIMRSNVSGDAVQVMR